MEPSSRADVGTGISTVRPANSVLGPRLDWPDEDLFRRVLGHYPTGAAVITAMTSAGPVGMAVNSFTSVSLDLPLVLFCPAHSSSRRPFGRPRGHQTLGYSRHHY
jgi:3-hydroxy-9,10-secoandrosta-1,3,5(10)-triene-9,17-dione monooxygenase reductase component